MSSSVYFPAVGCDGSGKRPHGEEICDFLQHWSNVLLWDTEGNICDENQAVGLLREHKLHLLHEGFVVGQVTRCAAVGIASPGCLDAGEAQGISTFVCMIRWQHFMWNQLPRWHLL